MQDLIKLYLNISLTLLLGVVPSQVLAHGEDKPGPHGGWVRMPGSFHTEVVPISNQELRVYLLDIGFANPITTDSKVEFSLNDGEMQRCAASVDFFTCTLVQPDYLDSSGALTIKATRANSSGAPVKYELPLAKVSR